MTTVERRVDDDRHDVVLGVDGEHAKALLTELAQAIGSDPGLGYEWVLLSRSLSCSDRRRAIALEALLDSIAVRRALHITFTPDQADDLIRGLDDAALEPARCRHCRSYAVPTADECARHLADGDDLERAS